eukprot:PITA_26205
MYAIQVGYANSKDKTTTLENILVIQEFADVFLEEIPRLPPKRDIVFTIELVPRAAPVSRSPCRMSVPKLTELKMQLQELLEKRYIHPSVSPWGAPVLFVKKKYGTLRMCYYRRFVEGFSRVAYPITSLHKKGRNFRWTPECQRSFEQLKYLLTTAPIPSIVDPSKEYEVCTDANYHSLTNYFSQPTLNVRHTWWADFQSSFDLEIKHLKGKENQVANALSQKLQCLYEVSCSEEKSPFGEMIKKLAKQDVVYQQIKQQVELPNNKEKQPDHALDVAGMLYYKGRLYVPNQYNIKNLILDEYHWSHYTRHPSYQKMIATLRKENYWLGMKKSLVGYLAQCLECQQIKAEHQHTVGLLQPIPIPEWKWEAITMDFITGLPKSNKNNDSIMVVVDKLSTSAHFIPVQSTYRVAQIAHVFMKNIFKLHGLPKTIISYCDVKFTSVFWKTLFEELETQLSFSTTYHPQTDGQTGWVNQVVEDMLRAYVMQKPNKWEDYLHLVEFSYNNGYHTSLQMSPFEALYGRKCHTPSSWSGPKDRLRLALEMLNEMEELVKKVELEGEIWVELLSILDQREVTLRKKDITQVKVQWQHFGPNEATWEDEEFMK